MDLSISELSLVIIVGLLAGTYAKSEGANSFLAAVVGIVTSLIVYLFTQ